MDEKNILRKKLQAQLNNISKPSYEHLSYRIAQNLFRETLWKEAEVIGITISRGHEVDTYQIIRKAWEENKKIAVPKCHPKDKTMTFHILTAFNQLEIVYYGLLEPKGEETKEIGKDDINLLIVPGLGFTKEGYRLGFGGGYYDRYLQGYKGKRISLAFKQYQLTEELPVEKHDIPVEKIITEEGMIDIAH